MYEDDFDLKNYIIYISEAINNYFSICQPSDRDFLATNFFISSLLKTCYESQTDCVDFGQIKLDFFQFLLSKYLGLDMRVQCCLFDLELIVAIAVENQIFGVYQVFTSCFKTIPHAKDSFFMKFEEVLTHRLEKKQEIEKTILFIIAIFIENGFGRNLLSQYIPEYSIR